jgi:hypothetical protein
VLSVLQEKLSEAHGLAIAATTVTVHVAERVPDAELRVGLERMRREAEETRARCLAAEQEYGSELGTELLAHANTVKEKAADLLAAWFTRGTGPLAAWSFLVMGEAAEVATWAALRELGARADPEGVGALAEWGLPIQEHHLRVALEGAVRLAELSDPHAARWG